jgi:hypothetical protein
VTDPAGPVAIGYLATPGEARRLVKSGEEIFLIDSLGLSIIDVTDPAAPVASGFAATPGSATDLAVTGEYAYVAAETGGLRVYDIAGPARPDEVWSHIAPNSTVNAVAVTGEKAAALEVVTEGFRPPAVYYFLNLYDATDPAAPVLTNPYSFAANSLALGGDLAYLGGFDVLTVLDLSDPATPIVAGTYQSRHWQFNSLSLSGERVYATLWAWGLEVIDVADPARPRWTGGYNTPGRAMRAVTVADRVYVADGDGGLIILEFVPADFRSFLPVSLVSPPD